MMNIYSYWLGTWTLVTCACRVVDPSELVLALPDAPVASLAAALAFNIATSVAVPCAEWGVATATRTVRWAVVVTEAFLLALAVAAGARRPVFGVLTILLQALVFAVYWVRLEAAGRRGPWEVYAKALPDHVAGKGLRDLLCERWSRRIHSPMRREQRPVFASSGGAATNSL